MPKTVGIIFSKDRAMQLEATLRSCLQNCRDVENIHLKVIWTNADSANEQQYRELENTYSSVVFLREFDFRAQVLQSIAGYEYVLFLVDDNIFVRNFAINHVTESLARHQDAVGFSLRLGINTNYCYPLRLAQQLPGFTKVEHGFLKFDWAAAQHDFAYPLEVSSSVYRIEDILSVLQGPFINPNTLELQLDASKTAFHQHKKFLLCGNYSYTFCNPVNRVQTIINNRAGESFSYSAQELSNMFAQGIRIDVESYKGLIPNACHQEMELKFNNIKQPVIEMKPQEITPQVSVIMPVYNAQEYLGQAIESILTQTFTDFELIIIDDGSTDDSFTIIQSYQDPRIVVLRNESNLRLIATLNKGLKLARGRYIARMDADDVSLPERLARQVEFLEQHPDIGMCGTWVELFGQCQPKIWDFDPHPDVVKCVLLFGCCVAHPSVMLRKTIVEEGFCYSNQYPHAEDYGLWVQIAQQYAIANLSQVLLKYRITDSQKSAKEAQLVQEGSFKIQLEQLKLLGIEPTEEEGLMHRSLSQFKFASNIYFAQAALDWLHKLKAANSSIGYYPEPMFTEVLRQYWVRVCKCLVNAI